MQTSKLVKLIVKIFLYAALASVLIFFLAVFIDTAIVNTLLPGNAHVEPTLSGSIIYAVYNSVEMSLFFTTFTLVIIKLSVDSGSILTIRDIIRYYRRFIIATFIAITALGTVLTVVVLNVYVNDLRYVSNALVNGDIITYALPFFWFILAAIYYKGYQSKITEPDGSKDRSWLEGNIEG